MPRVALATLPDSDGLHAVEVTVDGDPFTKYIWTDSDDHVLKKPVLNPLLSSRGTPVTRGYPLDPRPGERVDHPHHVGHWMNFGNVNGLDFWNNSDAVPEEDRGRFGTIKVRSVDAMEGGEGQGSLRTTSEWVSPSGQALIRETTHFIFRASATSRSFDRITTLTALEDVLFKDDKEGTFALRVARELEHPAEGGGEFTDAAGIVTQVEQMDNSGVVGLYRSSEGVEGDDVWGTRGDWVSLGGEIQGEPISVTIYDHPSNPGYPTYWHARGYGLFAANNLGQEALSDGKHKLMLALKAGEAATFRHRVVIASAAESDSEHSTCFADFVKSKL